VKQQEGIVGIYPTRYWSQAKALLDKKAEVQRAQRRAIGTESSYPPNGHVLKTHVIQSLRCLTEQEPSTQTPVSSANTLKGSVNAPLYRDPYLRTAFPGEQFGMNQAVFLNDTGANLTGRFTLFLHDGDLSVLTTGPAVSADDRYGLPLGSHTFAIGSGSGAFLNAKGVVVVTVSATGLRSFDVFLGPCRRP